MPDGRVLVAFDDPALEPSPTWTRIDGTDNLVASIDIRRGRQTELDTTDTSTATVRINDTAGLFDPNNMSSPYAGELDGKQIMLQCWNPVTATWVPQFRGHVDDYGYDLNPSLTVSTVEIQCVDLFEYLANVEMIPGLFGDPALSTGNRAGLVVYAETDFQTRGTQILSDALLPTEFFSVFTGNVICKEWPYNPADAVLEALRDTVDAEFPGIANAYTDKAGRVCLHGRYARFTPDSVSYGTDWDFTRWYAGTGGIVEAEDRAQVRPPLRFSRPRSRLINAAISYPQGILDKDIPGQIVVDDASVLAYGYRSWSARDLLVEEGFTTGNTANEECLLYANYYLGNYAAPVERVDQLTFKSIDPAASAGPKTWALICGVDISDIVDLVAGYPGGTGLAEEFYVEGSEMSIRPLNPDFDMVELTLNVSPASLYPPSWWS